MATHSSILAWRIRGMREPDELPSMGLQSQTGPKRLSSSSSSSSSINLISLGWHYSYSFSPFAIFSFKFISHSAFLGLTGSASGKELACQCRRHKRHVFKPCIRKIPWRRTWQPTPLFLPGEFHGQRSLVGYSPWHRKESDTTEKTWHACTDILPTLSTLYSDFFPSQVQWWVLARDDFLSSFLLMLFFMLSSIS